MSDQRRHRGPHPADAALFAESRLPALQQAVSDFSWLLSHDYSDRSALKLVGDRFQLTDRQRTAVMRCSCSDAALAARLQRQVSSTDLTGSRLIIDGFNLITSIEAALAGGVLIGGRDGCLRDMASMHGTYRRVEETEQAIRLIGERIAASGARQTHWLLDRPVSNSGRLRALIEQIAADHGWPWTTELHDSPDRQLIEVRDRVVVSADGIILQRCESWWPLANDVIESLISTAWMIDLAPDSQQHRGPAESEMA